MKNKGPLYVLTCYVIWGLLPIFWTAGTGSEIMTRIAAPMFGGMISAAALSMFILPAAYKLLLAARLLPHGRPQA